MHNKIDLSVIIATYNRAEILRRTLESMTVLERDGLSVEFVVVDNNNSDHTKQVIESFTDRLPIRYLFEPRPGRNCALNKALNEVPLGKLVVFADDDVEPEKDWLKAIITVTNRWPDYSVFGGKIYAIWPNGRPPQWAQSRSIQSLGFAVHEYEDSERPYKSSQYPFGGNFWVRREIFEDGRRFNEAIGPRPKDRVMGGETSFLKKLYEDGYESVYSPDAVVGHRIQPGDISISNMYKRARRYGRGVARAQPLCRQDLLNEHLVLWYLVRVAALVLLMIKLMVGMISSSQIRRVEKSTEAIKWISYNLESIKLAWGKI